MFSTQPFGAGEIAGYYYVKLGYSNMTTQKQVRKRYCEGVISATVDDFYTYTFNIPKKFFDCSGKDWKASIIPARFYYFLSINDCKYLLGHKNTKIQLHSQPRENNISFVQMVFSACASEQEYYQKIAAKAPQPQYIDIKQVLYIDYDSKYRFL